MCVWRSPSYFLLLQDSLVVVKSYECLLQCAALKDSSVAKTIGEYSGVPQKLVYVCLSVCACICMHARKCVCVHFTC